MSRSHGHSPTLIITIALVLIAITRARYLEDADDEPTRTSVAPRLTDRLVNNPNLGVDTSSDDKSTSSSSSLSSSSSRAARMEPHFGHEDNAATAHVDGDESRSPIDCSFDEHLGIGGMCSWHPNMEGRSLWRTGNAALVDSANAIVKPGAGDDRFAFVAGHVDQPSEGSLESVVFNSSSAGNAPGVTNQLNFQFWKAAFGPILDVCVRRVGGDDLDCIDSIAGVGTQRWTLRTLTLPRLSDPFQIVFRARNIHSAEDLIAIDDIKLRMSDNLAAPSPSSTIGRDDDRATAAASLSSLDGVDSSSVAAAMVATSGETRRAQPTGRAAIRFASSSLPPLDEEQMPMQDDDDNAPTAIIRPAPSTSVGRPVDIAIPSPPLLPPRSSPPPSPSSPPPTYLLHQNSPIPKKPDITISDLQSIDEPISNKKPASSVAPTLAAAEETSVCRAVKCNFLETVCQWQLDKNWRLNGGHIAVETGGDGVVAKSGYFKAPFAAWLEFDLWMSDDATLAVGQETREFGAPGSDELSLLERRGMAARGWHRFRVPLRPAFNPIRLLLRVSLPPSNGAFAAVSNTRLVTASGDEVDNDDQQVGIMNCLQAVCELASGMFVPPPPMLPPLAPLPPPPPPPPMPTIMGPGGGSTPSTLWASGVPVMNGLVQTSGGGASAASSPLAALGAPFSMPAIDMSPAIALRDSSSSAAASPSTLLDSFAPHLVDGITPIVPMRDTTQRLTAYQNLQLPFTLPTLAPAVALPFPGLFDPLAPSSPTLQPQREPLARPNSNDADEPNGDSATRATANGDNNNLMMSTPSAEQTIEELAARLGRGDRFGVQQAARDLASHSAGGLIAAVANNPALETQLRMFAQHAGYDTSRWPERAALVEHLRRLFGPRSSSNDATATSLMPASVIAAASRSRDGGDESASPIRPTNVDQENFERGVHEAAAMKTNTNQLGTAEMLQQFASIFKSPALSSSSTSSNAVVNRDLQSPLLRNNRDLGLRDSLVVR